MRPAPLPRALEETPQPEVENSPALSLFSRPGDGIRTRRIAILVAHGIDVDGASARAIHDGLTEEGAVPRYIGARLGQVRALDGDPIEVEVSMEAMPAVLFDALVVLGGKMAARTLGTLGHAVDSSRTRIGTANPYSHWPKAPT